MIDVVCSGLGAGVPREGNMCFGGKHDCWSFIQKPRLSHPWQWGSTLPHYLLRRTLSNYNNSFFEMKMVSNYVGGRCEARYEGSESVCQWHGENT